MTASKGTYTLTLQNITAEQMAEIQRVITKGQFMTAGIVHTAASSKVAA